MLFDVRLGEILGRVRLEGEGGGEVAGVAFRNGQSIVYRLRRVALTRRRRYFANARPFIVDWTYRAV